MHGKKKVTYLLSPAEREVEGHLEDSAECPWCCTHLDDATLAPARKRAEIMGYFECEKEDVNV